MLLLFVAPSRRDIIACLNLAASCVTDQTPSLLPRSPAPGAAPKGEFATEKRVPLARVVCVNGQETECVCVCVCVCLCKTAALSLSGIQNDFIESEDHSARLDARRARVGHKTIPAICNNEGRGKNVEAAAPLDWRFLSVLRWGKLHGSPARLPDVWRFKLPFLSRPK